MTIDQPRGDFHEKVDSFFSFNNPRSKITFNFEQSTKEDLRTLYSKKKTSWCFLESQSMECKWSKNKILYNAVNIKYFPNYYEGQAFASCTTLSSRKRNLPGLTWYSQYMCFAQNGKFNSNVSKTLKRRKTRQGQTRLSYTAVSSESPSTIVWAIFVQIEQGSCPNCKQYLCQIMAQRTKWGQIGLSPHRVGQALRQDRWGRWLCGPGPVTTTCCD